MPKANRDQARNKRIQADTVGLFQINREGFKEAAVLSAADKLIVKRMLTSKKIRTPTQQAVLDSLS